MATVPRSRLPFEAAAVALALGLIWAVVEPHTADLAAQVYRAGLFRRAGFTVWDNSWFAGHYIPGYSIVVPPLSGLLGTRLVGVSAAVATAGAFAAVLASTDRAGVVWAARWLGVATLGELLVGRVTFLVGSAVGFAAILALQRSRAKTAVALSVLASLASPIAGAFLALVGCCWALAERRRLAWVMAGAALGSVAAVQSVAPEGGVQPFSTPSFTGAMILSLACAAWWARRDRVLAWSSLAYASALCAAYVVPTAMGSNVTRLGAVLGVPLLLARGGFRSGHRWGAVLVLVLAVYQWTGPVGEVVRAVDDRAGQANYYAPLLRYLAGRPGLGWRVEVVPTATRWEAVYVAPRFLLARGWETQADDRYDAIFFGPRLTATAYRRWLRRDAVRYVALSDSAPEQWSAQEQTLVRRGVTGLQPVWHSAHWRVYRVRGAAPLVQGPGRVLGVTPSAMTLRAERGAILLVRVRWTPYWDVPRRVGCVAPAPGGWTRVRVTRPGLIRLRATFEPAAILDESQGDC